MGKTSLVERYIKGTFSPNTTLSTVGASFRTKRATDVDSGTVVRLQIWDTAGQERFRSLTQLYYRGASAVILVYSIVDACSFADMGRWLDEVRAQLGDDCIIHVVGTKSDVVAEDPSRRAVPFEQCIAYVAERLHPTLATTRPSTAGTDLMSGGSDKRQSGFWVHDVGWDDCHEISASSGEGIDEVFRVVTRKLVEKHTKAIEEARPAVRPMPPAPPRRGHRGTLDAETNGRPGVGDKRRSWLGLPVPSPPRNEGLVDIADTQRPASGRCC